MEQDLISVIVPMYNNGKYIERCVNSIRNQTYKNLEIILIDDASTDDTRELCDNFKLLDNRIIVKYLPLNRGVSNARNIGLNIAKGNYIAFVDSDDYIHKNMYENMLKIMKREEVDIVACQWFYMDKNNHQCVDFTQIDKNIYGKKSSIEFEKYLYKGSYENGVVVAVWNKLYRRNILDTLQFKGFLAEDEELNDKIYCNNVNVYIDKEPYYYYCQNLSSLTNEKFSEKKIYYLDILQQRCQLFKDEFIINNTKKLYCNIYIEYYYKSLKNDININKKYKKTFRSFFADLKKAEGVIDYKSSLRFLIFLVSPKIYGLLFK